MGINKRADTLRRVKDLILRVSSFVDCFLSCSRRGAAWDRGPRHQGHCSISGLQCLRLLATCDDPGGAAGEREVALAGRSVPHHPELTRL